MCIGATFISWWKLPLIQQLQKKLGKKEEKMRAASANWLNSIFTPTFDFAVPELHLIIEWAIE
jgi:hypothetical protein